MIDPYIGNDGAFETTLGAVRPVAKNKITDNKIADNHPGEGYPEGHVQGGVGSGVRSVFL